MRNKLTDMQNRLQRYPAQIFAARQTISKLEAAESEAERKLLAASVVDAGGNAAGALLPPPLGSAVGVGTTVLSAYEISRLQAELERIRKDLARARADLAEIEHNQHQDEENVPRFKENMCSEGCHVP
jgi:prefoldin subunit 5